MKLNFLIIVAAIVSFACSATAETILILDSGHDPKFKGAISSCGTPEFKLNDEIVQNILNYSDIKISLTRSKNEPPTLVDKNNYTNIESLKSRIILSNKLEHNSVFISIHHDSVSEKYLEYNSELCNGLGGKKIDESFKKQFKIGFNIFVYDENTERFEQSIKLAKIISKKLIALGQIASNYHFPTSDDCKSCRPLDINLGIWHQNLLVLRENKNPAILIEVGNLMDPDDYKNITSETFKRNFGSLVNDAVNEFIN